MIHILADPYPHPKIGPSTGSGQEDPIELDTGLMDWEMGGGDPAPLQDDLAPPQDNPALPQDNLALASYITASDASDPTMVHMYTSLSDREQELVVWFPLSDMERRVSRVYSPSIINPAPSMSPTPSPASLVPTSSASHLLFGAAQQQYGASHIF